MASDSEDPYPPAQEELHKETVRDREIDNLGEQKLSAFIVFFIRNR